MNAHWAPSPRLGSVRDPRLGFVYQPRMTAAVLLTDIEGTTSSIAFVKDTLFPFARAHLDAFLREHRGEAEVEAQIRAVCDEANVNEDRVADVLRTWMDDDLKATPLKAVQGMIWRRGYEDGTLKSHMYPDAVRGLRRLHDAGVGLAVYSSGSVPAQKLLFGYTEHGDLTGLISAWFDTRIGAKKEAESYRRIAERLSTPAESIVFTSDVEAELDAARAAGFATIQLVRPEDGTQPSRAHPTARTFADVLPEVGS